jgi:hypothetical protein
MIEFVKMGGGWNWLRIVSNGSVELWVLLPESE